MNLACHARDLRKDYVLKGETVHALRGISFDVPEGDYVAIMGPSGSGKSTLLNLLGLLDRPSGGTLRLLGHDTGSLDEDELTRMRGRSLGFVFQFHHLMPALSAVENVAMPLFVDDKRTRAEHLERAKEMLARVGLAARASDLPRHLSGGEQQRVAIARALVHAPPLVLADEPTGNLDTQTAEQVFALLRRLNRELGMAFLIVTHDRRLAARADREIELVDGRIVRHHEQTWVPET